VPMARDAAALMALASKGLGQLLLGPAPLSRTPLIG
jgi:hypothetical protein